MIKTPEQVFKTGVSDNINENFKWIEFIDPLDKKPTLLILKNIKKIADILNSYKKKLFHGSPITITSGWRSLAHHLAIYKDLGITDKSQIPMKSYHLSGLAVDFRVKNFTNQQVYALMDKIHFGGVECVDNQNRIHIDLRQTNCRFKGNGTIVKCNYNVVEHEKVFRK